VPDRQQNLYLTAPRKAYWLLAMRAVAVLALDAAEALSLAKRCQTAHQNICTMQRNAA